MTGYLTSFENDIFGKFDQMRRQMNRLFGDFGSQQGSDPSPQVHSPRLM